MKLSCLAAVSLICSQAAVLNVEEENYRVVLKKPTFVALLTTWNADEELWSELNKLSDSLGDRQQVAHVNMTTLPLAFPGTPHLKDPCPSCLHYVDRDHEICYQYTGPVKHEAMQLMLEKRFMGEASKAIGSEDVADKVERFDVGVHATFKNESAVEKYTRVAQRLEGVPFFHSVVPYESETKEEVVVHFKGKQFTYSGAMQDMAAIENFVRVNSFSPVTEFSSSMATRLLEDGRPLIIFVHAKDAPEFEEFKKFQTAVASLSESVLAVSVTHEGDAELRFIEKLTKHHPLPSSSVWILPDPSFQRRYLMTAEITSTNVTQFVEDFQAGNLQHHIRTLAAHDDDHRSFAALTDREKKLVKAVTGASFKRDVLESDRDVLLTVYADGCIHSDFTLFNMVLAAAQRKDVLFAKIHGVENELPDFVGQLVVGYPTVIFFKRGYKDEPVVFKAIRNSIGVISFLDIYSPLPNNNNFEF